RGVGDDGLDLVGQGVVLRLVEDDFESFRRLVEALQHADLGYVGEAQQTVGRCVVEFGAVQQATVQSGNDFAAGQGVHSCAHCGEQVNGQAVGAELQTLEVFDLGDRLLEPAEGLRGYRAIHDGNHVDPDGCIEFVQQLLAAAILVP